MDYIHKKLHELRVCIAPSSASSTSAKTAKCKDKRRKEKFDFEEVDEIDMISLPSCSQKSDDEYYSCVESNPSIDNSISSLLGGHVLAKRSREFRYVDAVRSATYSKSEFVLHSLQWHNILRSQHTTPPLMLSLDLCQKAQFWANHLCHTDTFYHMHDTHIGQNLLSKCTYYSEFDPSAEEIVKYWYNYIDSYDYSLAPNLLHTQANHFTQMLWKSTKYFGIGKARTRNGKMIVVANYMPRGNVCEQFVENVLPLVYTEFESRRNTVAGSERKLIRRSANRLKRNRHLSDMSAINGMAVDSSV